MARNKTPGNPLTEDSKIEKPGAKRTSEGNQASQAILDGNDDDLLEDIMRSVDEKEFSSTRKTGGEKGAAVTRVPGQKVLNQGVKKMIEKNKRQKRAKMDPKLRYYTREARLAKTNRRKTPK